MPIHPARFPPELPDFFIRFLTKPGQLVLDPFAGSNVTGQVAETLGRRWIEHRDQRGLRGRLEIALCRAAKSSVSLRRARAPQSGQQDQRLTARVRNKFRCPLEAILQIAM